MTVGDFENKFDDHTSWLIMTEQASHLQEYTLPAKNMEYFLFQRLFAFLWAVQGISELEILSYEQILLLEELIST